MKHSPFPGFLLLNQTDNCCTYSHVSLVLHLPRLSVLSCMVFFSRKPSIPLAFPSMLLHFPFILESVFNFPALSFILIFLCQPRVFYFPCIVVSFLSRYPFHGLLYSWLISLSSSACKAFHHTLYIKTTTKTPQKMDSYNNSTL